MSNQTTSGFKLDWDSKFEVGHERIDFEHQIFLGLIKKLAEIEKSSPKSFERYLVELRKYAEFHFVSEENIMIDCNYPEYENHKLLHAELIQELDEHLTRYTNNTLQEGAFIAFLYEWFIHHTMVEDLKLSEFIRGE